MNKDMLIIKIKEIFDVEPENTFHTTNVITFRHKNKNKKMFGVLMCIAQSKVGLKGNEKIWLLNVKVNKDKDFGLRNIKGILPAFHMNKANWIGIDIMNMSFDLLIDLIHDSYQETK